MFIGRYVIYTHLDTVREYYPDRVTRRLETPNDQCQRFLKFQPYLNIEKNSPHLQPIIENQRPDVDGRAVLAWFFAQ